jgi:hypothetical protein
MRLLADRAAVTIYTPGSGAGVGLNVLGSLTAPPLDWGSDAEVIRDEIRSLVSSILTLAGIDSDPVAGPEHILLSTIVETLWRQDKDLDLATLVGQVPNPPFRKLGVFDVDTFLPQKERMDLALRLNGLLASPSFASWLEGAPLDINEMLGGDGPTKAAVVYLSHLAEEERQFLVTLLLSKMVTWIRAQPGTSGLRALIYMDEMFGFAPPTAEPPSKRPILTILKQARAHGVGMVVSTQNPVDLDYKAMSNAGTWMIGRLQTENDKKRILEGLTSASGGVDMGSISASITDLQKRQFVLHSAGGGGPRLFSTRWAMSYLAGPLTRDQIATLKPDQPIESWTATHEAAPATVDMTTVAPAASAGVPTVYLDPAASWAGVVGADPTGSVLEPAVAATVQLLYDDTTAAVSHTELFEAVIHPLGAIVDGANLHIVDHDDRDFRSEPIREGEFRITDLDLGSKTFWSGLESGLRNHLVANRPLQMLRNPALKIYSRPAETAEDFERRCQEVVAAGKDAAITKVIQSFASRVERARTAVTKAQARVRDLEIDASSKQQEELLTGAGDLLGAIFGGRKSSTAISQAARRRAASQKAKDRAEAALADVDEESQDLADLDDELAEAIETATADLDDAATAIETVEIPLEKTDIEVADLKLVWLPKA